MKNCLRLFAGFGLILTAACQTLPPPSGDLADARLRVEAAEAADAQTHAPVEFQFARDKLARAEELIEAGDHAAAARQIAEARADADLAQVRAEAARLRAELDERMRANEALRADLLGRGAP